MATNEARAAKLNQLFNKVIHKTTEISKGTYKQFIESICAQADPATCISKLNGSPGGLAAIQAAMRFDLTPTFCNDLAARLFRYLSSPELITIGNGTLLKVLLPYIVKPPIFWNDFKGALTSGKLNEEAEFGFAWLLSSLISLLPLEDAADFRSVASDSVIMKHLFDSRRLEVRNLAQSIKHSIATFEQGGKLEDHEAGPGGRHDNDFAEFRQISVIPTADEIQSTQPAFIRPSIMFEDHETKESRQAIYCDNQFRLLREDMLYEIREEMAAEKKRKNHRNFAIDGLRLDNVHYEPPDEKKRGIRWAIVLQCTSDLWQLSKGKEKLNTPEKRKKWFRDNHNVIKHQSMACLMVEQELIALTTIERDEDLLARIPPQIVVRIEGAPSIVRALLKLKTAARIKLVQMNAAIFAYQPILQALKETKSIPLAPELLFWSEGCQPQYTANIASRIIQSVRENSGNDLQQILRTSKPIVLDKSQSASLLMGLTHRVSLIQGPPGTGKSFIGALLAKTLHDYAGSTILVVCYTNHALDQFLEDLMDIGIPPTSMVRLGGKSTDRTQNLALRHIQRSSPAAKFTRADWAEIQSIKAEIQKHQTSLARAAGRYQLYNPKYDEILEFLEFEDPDYCEALTLPSGVGGLVGRGGKSLGKTYLINQWANGWNAGVLRHHDVVTESASIWEMNPAERKAKLAHWKEAILKDQVQTIQESAQQYDLSQSRLDAKFEEKDGMVLVSKQIIGCTTTAAAKYREHINAAKPDILLVEEAGEILESHVLTALAPTVKQLILIGDHKQLRPKVNNYQLTVEKGEGYDLNRSLFERLVLKGYPHETLSQQHRMRPEISALVRHLTYPDLVDAEKTKGRADVRGLMSNLVFIHHNHAEDDLLEASHLTAQPDETSAKSSKSNKYEVEMVLKILRYLGQQGYHTDQIVILTPYLGQLRALQEALKKDNDPILNDLDYGDLVRAGLVSSAAAQVAKKPIRLATIDNYQGEESDIVLVSLTRSNAERKIGFMSSPERVNVLLSRARDGLVMIGDANTFLESKGSKVWPQLFDLLKQKGHIYDGLPVKCEKHPSRTAILECPDDFDQKSPDGGCTQPCGTMLKCTVHFCPSRCHQVVDHSKMKCEAIIYFTCPKGHRRPFECHSGPPDGCAQCVEDIKQAEKKQKAALVAQQKREKEQRLHDQKMAEIEAKITKQNEALRDAQLAEERKRALEQRQNDLGIAVSAAFVPSQPEAPSSTSRASPTAGPQDDPVVSPSPQPTASSTKAQPKFPPKATTSSKPASGPKPPVPSSAEAQWKRQKEIEGAKNEAIDSIMQMGGLEKVKQQVLDIKSKVEITSRQGGSLKDVRFSASMLGNPGTGKTTVARIYGRFLASMQVIQGTTFEETTGSRLANEGVNGVKQMIDNLVNAGGGTLFIDEAYQLTSVHNPGGGKVLDFLLAEIENQVGKIVFLFAGYNREMEKFFEHNPGLTSRVPYTLQFEDYTDEILMDILEKMITKKFSGRMRVDDPDGLRGLYGRIAVRRLGRGRGKPGFGNARALENLWDRIHGRQTQRIDNAKRNGVACDALLLLPEDLIGPDPSSVMTECAAWKQLQGMIGLDSVKDSVTSFFKMVKMNYDRELLELEPHQVSLNRVFLGSPGTGKTTVAKLYGSILAELGLISNGEVVVKNPADFIGGALGQSESQTKGILASTVGKVLVIDEAYMLYAGSGTADLYRTAVIDTIVAEVQSVPGEDRCVLLLGYKEQMEEMFQNVNPGLARRFAIENAFQFHDYSDAELMKALEWKLRSQQLTATDDAKRVAIEVLSRARNRPNFGNIGEVENMLSSAKIRYQARTSSPDAPFEPQDFDPDYRRNESAAVNLAALFKDIVGSDAVVEKLGNFQRMAQTCKEKGMDPREMIPTNFVFKGPPGTGKTTTARKMGQVFFDMGFLSSTDVEECSTSDLVGQYVGHTGPKTKKLLEKARGRVLFIDEAYRLGEGHFAKEAVDELVSTLALEEYKGRIIVILAGYDKEINDMLAVNPGLSSRFTEEIIFTNMSAAQCIDLLNMELSKKGVVADTLMDPRSVDYRRLATLLESLSRLPSWGNARDIKELARRMIVIVFTTGSSKGLTLTGEEAIACVTEMLSQRTERATHVTNKDPFHNLFREAVQGPQTATPPPRTERTQTTETVVEPPKPEDAPERKDGRDLGVSDAVWEQLQKDRRAEELAEVEAQEERMAVEVEVELARKREEKELEALTRVLAAEKAAKDEEERERLMREREQLRLRELAAREERALYERRLAAQREEEAKRRREEAQVQKKIRELGICPAGFRWIKQSHGYRCAGGSHFLDNTALGI